MAEKKEKIYEEVRGFYGQLIDAAQREETSCGCGSTASCCTPSITKGYSGEELSTIPKKAADSSFGCGNPLAFTEVKEGEAVLDLGSGSGIDCFLAADRVGESGRVIGLDMTPEMIERAALAAKESGYHNVEFTLGKIEEMPVDDSSVDWVISNCVINLSPEKEKVFAEAYRVLKPGGRLLVSDIVAEDLPASLRQDITAWAGCVAGAVSESEYLELIGNAGFEEVEVVERMEYLEPSDDKLARISSVRISAIRREDNRKGGA